MPVSVAQRLPDARVATRAYPEEYVPAGLRGALDYFSLGGLAWGPLRGGTALRLTILT